MGAGWAGAAETVNYRGAEVVKVEILKASEKGPLLYADPGRMAKWLAVFRVSGKDGEEKLLKIAMHSPVRSFRSPANELAGRRFDLKIEPGGESAPENEIRLTIARTAVAEGVKDDAVQASVAVDKKEYRWGEVVKIKVKASVPEVAIRFRCRIYVEDPAGEWRESIPSLVANGPKQEEPVYELPGDGELAWDYRKKPGYFRPTPGKNYAVVVEILGDKDSQMIMSSAFQVSKP